MIDHDRLFKELLTTFFADFAEVFLPELAGYLDASSLEFLDKELFSDLKQAERQEADLVVKARFRGQGAFFLVHLEHQAQEQAAFGQRLFRYFARFHEKYQWPVYPIALFSHAGLKPEPDLYQVSFPDREVLRFQFRVIQLSRLHWRDYLHYPNASAAALMAKMGMKAAERPRVKVECLRLLTKLPLAPRAARLVSGFIDTYLRLSSEEALLFQSAVDSLLHQTEKSKVMELTTSWKEEGRQEGRQEGQVDLVLRLLVRRCGPLPPATQSKVRSLCGSDLETLGEALLDFSSLADLNSWLGSRG